MEMTRILEHCIEILRLLPDILICHKTCLLSCIYSLQTETTRHGSLAILRIVAACCIVPSKLCVLTDLLAAATTATGFHKTSISLRDHVPNVDILNRCNTLSVESQLQGKRLRWLGHVFRMPNDRLPKKLLFGQVKGLRPPGRPRSSFNAVALQDCQARGINRPYRDAQDRLLWKDKTCPART